MLAYFLQGFPRDVPGQSRTGRPVVPLSQDKGRSKCPGTSRDKIIPQKTGKGRSKTGKGNFKTGNHAIVLFSNFKKMKKVLN